MYKPQLKPLPILKLPESRLNYPAMKTIKLVTHQYKASLNFKTPKLKHPERLVNAYKDFFDDKNRLILAFRHPYGDDAHLMVFLIHVSLPRAAKKLKVKLPKFVHAHFLYGVEVPMWSSSFVRWLLPQVGAVPVNHTRMDAKGMNVIRKMFTDGTFPVALAPEGHVTYASERILDLENGTSRFAFWTMEDLEKAKCDKKVAVLPISIHYRYGKKAPKKLNKMLNRIEKVCGLEKNNFGKKELTNKIFIERLRAIGSSVLDHLSIYYKKTISILDKNELALPATECSEQQRIIFEACLSTAERILSIVPSNRSNAMARIYKIRTESWELIFRDDIEAMTPLRYEISCKETGLAWFAMRHLEISYLLNYVDFSNINDDLNIHQIIEIANNYYDIIERIKGGTLKNRANIFKKHPIVIPAKPIIVDDLKEEYKTNRKTTIQKLTDKIKQSFIDCISEYKDDCKNL